MRNSSQSSVVSRQLPSMACKMCLLVVALLSCEFKSYSQDKEPQPENPFVPVLGDIAGAAEGKCAEILLDGKKIFSGRSKAGEELNLASAVENKNYAQVTYN